MRLEELDLKAIEDEKMRHLIGELLNIIEDLRLEVREVRVENQRLRDENNRLKGELLPVVDPADIATWGALKLDLAHAEAVWLDTEHANIKQQREERLERGGNLSVLS